MLINKANMLYFFSMNIYIIYSCGNFHSVTSSVNLFLSSRFIINLCLIGVFLLLELLLSLLEFLLTDEHTCTLLVAKYYRVKSCKTLSQPKTILKNKLMTFKIYFDQAIIINYVWKYKLWDFIVSKKLDKLNITILF